MRAGHYWAVHGGWGLLLAAACTLVPQYAIAAPDDEADVQLRGTLNNARQRFDSERRGHVAFMGGSITEMDGYRPMVGALLQKRFPGTEFTFTNAGISSTCSTTGAFRLETDVLSRGPVDLFFVEFAVNDDQDAHLTTAECMRGFEGIVRQVHRHNPRADIVVTYFVNPEMLATIDQGKMPLTISAHSVVAERYDISSINLARHVARQIKTGTLTWQKFGGVHPAPFGNALCAGLIGQLFDRAWSQPLPADYTPATYRCPDALERFNYERGRFIGPQQAMLSAGWQVLTPHWKEIKGGWRERFRDVPMLCGDAATGEVSLEFHGTAIGAYLLAGPDAGIVEVRIDDSPSREINLLHRFSANLHYPRTVMFGDELGPGRHTMRLRIAEQATQGRAVRILQFVAN